MKGYKHEKICQIFDKRGNTPKSQRILMKVTPSDSTYQRTLLWRLEALVYKYAEFNIFARRKVT